MGPLPPPLPDGPSGAQPPPRSAVFRSRTDRVPFARAGAGTQRRTLTRAVTSAGMGSYNSKYAGMAGGAPDASPAPGQYDDGVRRVFGVGADLRQARPDPVFRSAVEKGGLHVGGEALHTPVCGGLAPAIGRTVTPRDCNRQGPGTYEVKPADLGPLRNAIAPAIRTRPAYLRASGGGLQVSSMFAPTGQVRAPHGRCTPRDPSLAPAVAVGRPLGAPRRAPGRPGPWCLQPIRRR